MLSSNRTDTCECRCFCDSSVLTFANMHAIIVKLKLKFIAHFMDIKLFYNDHCYFAKSRVTESDRRNCCCFVGHRLVWCHIDTIDVNTTSLALTQLWWFSRGIQPWVAAALHRYRAGSYGRGEMGGWIVVHCLTQSTRRRQQ